MNSELLAEVLHPAHVERGFSIVGACVLNAGKISAKQMRQLSTELPDADITFDKNGLKIEVELPGGSRSKRDIFAFSREISRAIRRSLGVMSGFCPVESTQQILRVTRAG